uniref:uncharacterized protein LOC103795837 isoform X2 n=1 Tax=Callithrix jacchus TaxID=9483 RepID=UPI0023DD1582|nr:uncharacterized protein LOC103795837 isoform X2 [Callithrix jacchus]
MWILSARGIWWTVTNSGDISGTIAIEMDEGTYIHALDNGLFTLGAPHREESAGRGQDVWTDTSMPVLSEDSGLHETLALLTSQLRPDSSHKEEMGFLRDVFSEKSLSYLMKIHEKLHYYERQSPTPVLHSAMALTEDAVLMVHDTVAQKNFDPVLPCLPDNIDEDFDEESVKIVRPLGEEQGTLGATIRRDEHSGAVVVARIIRGGAADRSGLVHVGDELREVNGITVLHKRPDEISQILVCAACLLGTWWVFIHPEQGASRSQHRFWLSFAVVLRRWQAKWPYGVPLTVCPGQGVGAGGGELPFHLHLLDPVPWFPFTRPLLGPGPACESWLCLLLGVQPWASYQILSVSISFSLALG